LIIEYAEAKQIVIYTVDGRKMYENPNPSEREIIDIGTWSAGLYVVKIQTDKGVVLIEKVIKK
jgi:hypothetical protein